MKRALVIGNGESRAWFRSPRWVAADDVVTWGCNAIYRDGKDCVDNLVSMDYGMQQEIYDSGWFQGKSKVYFSNWSPVPSEVADMMFMGTDIPESFVHRSKNKTSQCVISGKDPATLHETVEYTMKMHPNLDMHDLRLKMGKTLECGLHIQMRVTVSLMWVILICQLVIWLCYWRVMRKVLKRFMC